MDAASESPDTPSQGPISLSLFAALMVAYVVVRIALGLITGDEDSQYFQNWAYKLGTTGIAEAYQNPVLDYPPLILYLFYPIGRIYHYFLPVFDSAALHGSPFFVLLIKLPNLFFDFVLAGLLYWLVASQGLWTSARMGSGWGRVAALVYLWNPTVLWGSGFWGQPDAIHSAFVVASFAALCRYRWFVAGMLLAAACMTKPLAAPLVPLFIVGLAALGRMRAVLWGGVGGFAAATFLLLPFLLAGKGMEVILRLVNDINAMKFTSMNAHNFWTVVAPWRKSTEPMLGSLTPQTLSMILFAAACVPLLLRAWRFLSLPEQSTSSARTEIRYDHLFLLVAAVYCSFFYFSVHMHENHLYLAIPLLLILAGRGKQFAWLAAAASIACFLNMALHDLDLPYQLRSILSARSPFEDPYLVFDNKFNPTRHAYGSDVHYTWLQVVVLGFNLMLTAATCFATYRLAWRGPQPELPAGNTAS